MRLMRPPLQAGFKTPPARESGEDKMASEKLHATKTARDGTLRARRNARGHDKERMTVKAILSREM